MAGHDAEREFETLRGDSRLLRGTVSFATQLSAAWESSRTRAWMQSLNAMWRGQTLPARIRLLGVVALVAMATHVSLVVLDARAIEPLTLLIPAVIAGLALVALIMAEPLARLLD